MKKLLDVAHGKLINIKGRHSLLDQYLWTSVKPRNGHWCSKSVQKLQLLSATVGEVGCFSNQTILVEITKEFRGLLPKGKFYICHQNSSRIPLRKRSQLKPCHTCSYSHKSSKNTIDCGKYFNFATSCEIGHYNCH